LPQSQTILCARGVWDLFAASLAKDKAILFRPKEVKVLGILQMLFYLLLTADNNLNLLIF